MQALKKNLQSLSDIDTKHTLDFIEGKKSIFSKTKFYLMLDLYKLS